MSQRPSLTHSKLLIPAVGAASLLLLAGCGADSSADGDNGHVADSVAAAERATEVEAAQEVTVEHVKQVFPGNADPLLAGYGTDSGYSVLSGKEIDYQSSTGTSLVGPDASQECKDAQGAWEDELVNTSFASSTAHSADPADPLGAVHLNLYGGEFPGIEMLRAQFQIACVGEHGSDINPINGSEVFTYQLFGADNMITIVAKTANGVTASAASGVMPREDLEQLVDGMLERSKQLPVAYSQEI